jgi:hypothetical protein
MKGVGMKILNNLKNSHENGCTLEGSLLNALTSALSSEIEGVSVDILDDEIMISQHPDCGDFELILKF